MIFTKSVLNVTDNTGVKYVKTIKIIRTKSSYGKKQIGGLGDILLVSIRILKPVEKIKKGQLFKALIVRTKRQINRIFGLVKFEENAVILLNKKLEPLGNRIFGPLSREAIESNFVKFASIRIKSI
jgi:large subunit ribosomal protein L14